MDFDKLSRGDLQKLAKKYGLKANRKNKELIAALKEVCIQENDADSNNYLTDDDGNSNVEEAEVEVVEKDQNNVEDIGMLSELLTEDDSGDDFMEATSQKGSAITGSIKQHAAIQEYESDDELSTTRDINVSIIIPDIVVINDDAVNDVTGGLLPTSSTPAKVGKDASEVNVDIEIKKEIADETFTLPEIGKRSSSRRKRSPVKQVNLSNVVSFQDYNKTSGSKVTRRTKRSTAELPVVTADLNPSKSSLENASETTSSKISTPQRTASRKRSRLETPKSVVNPKISRSTKKNWSKIHERSESKLLSIDEYERKKKERRERLLMSSQKRPVSIKEEVVGNKRTSFGSIHVASLVPSVQEYELERAKRREEARIERERLEKLRQERIAKEKIERERAMEKLKKEQKENMEAKNLKIDKYFQNLPKVKAEPISSKKHGPNIFQIQRNRTTPKRKPKQSSRQIKDSLMIKPFEKQKIKVEPMSRDNDFSSELLTSPVATSSLDKGAADFKPVTDIKLIQTGFHTKFGQVCSRNNHNFVFKSKIPCIRRPTVSRKKNMPAVAGSSTPLNKENKRVPSVVNHRNSFKVGNGSFIATPNKKFDLKTSLKRPLKYTPHTGPLEKFEDTTKMSMKAMTSKNKQTNQRGNRRVAAAKSRDKARDAVVAKKRAMK